MRDDWRPGEDIRKGMPSREEFWREIRAMSSATYQPSVGFREMPGFNVLGSRSTSVRRHRIMRIKAMIANGLSDREIARTMGMADCTIHSIRIGEFSRVKMFHRRSSRRAA